MTRFVDVYMPAEIPGYPCVSSPRFSTTITTTDSGAEQANRNWQNPLWKYTLPEATRDWDVIEELRRHWLVMGGPAHTWPFRDPLDFASVDLPYVPILTNDILPLISMTDQIIGTGDGAKTQFQLTKTYSRAGATDYARSIDLPIVSTVLVSVAGADVSMSNPWTVSRPGGIIEFTTPPTPGQSIRAGFLFDVEVRFEADDSFDQILRATQAGGFANIVLTGVRSC